MKIQIPRYKVFKVGIFRISPIVLMIYQVLICLKWQGLLVHVDERCYKNVVSENLKMKQYR